MENAANAAALAHSQSTRHYRQAVLRLAESSNTKVAWVASQHVLDQIWKEDDVSYGASIQRPLIASTAKTTTAAIPVHYACQECGYRLHPGWNSTQLRVERPTKKRSSSSLSTKIRHTIRRREQRQRAKQARAKAMEAKTMVVGGIGAVGAGSRPNPSARNNDTPSKLENWQQQAEEKYQLVLLEDDPSASRLDRNRLVVKCGRCHAKYFLRGPRQPQQPRGKPHHPKNSSSSSSSRLQSPNDIRRQSKSSANQSVVSTTKDDSAASLQDNFEPLPPAPVAARTPNNKRQYTPSSLSSSLSSSKPKTLLEQRQEEQYGRKKKKKKTDDNTSGGNTNNNGKSKLLNFLSSLNDH